MTQTITLHWAADRADLAITAARHVQGILARNPAPSIALPTGETPTGMYHKLAELHQHNGLSFRGARLFNLDEYVGMGPDSPKSYHAFLHHHFLDHIDAKPENVRLLRGDTADHDAECRAYDAAIAQAGGLDLAILGLGGNGHLAFCEPHDPWDLTTHQVTLAETTRKAHRPNFAKESDIPRFGLTMGLKTLRNARQVLLLCAGASKKAAMAAFLKGEKDEAWPVTCLIGHPDLTVIADKELQPIPA